ncbi:unnamed protein product [Effrenium voratum]|nr:unnamed protein product [Effrenium voratum]
MAEGREESNWCAPQELSGRPLSKEQRRQRRRAWLLAVVSYDNCAACPLLLLATLVVAVVLLSQNQEPFPAATPALFGEGHIFQESREAKAVFSGLPSPFVIAGSSLQNATSCFIDAVPSVECSWFSCKADRDVELAGSSCDCDYRMAPTASEIYCEAKARFAGLQQPPENFWAWAQERVDLNISRERKAKEPPLEVEEWSSGQNVLQTQSSSSAFSAVENHTCFEAQCYCGRNRCLRPSNWASLGELPVGTTTIAPEPASNATDIYIIWGLKQKNRPDDTGELALEPMDLADPEACGKPMLSGGFERSELSGNGAMDFLALPRGKHVELEHEEHDEHDEHDADADADAESYEFEFPWEPLDPMSPEDIAAAPRSCVGHLELHGCGLVRGALAPERCAALRGFVDAELQRLLQELERLEQDEDQARDLERQFFGTVRDRQHRWDLKLPLRPEVTEAMQEVLQSIRGVLEGTVTSEGLLVELSCLITDCGAPMQNVHVDTGGWKTACAPLLTIFVALQHIDLDMGPTVLFPGTHDDPYLQQWLTVMPGKERTPEQFGGGVAAQCSAGSAVLMNSRLLHCGGENKAGSSGRRRLFYMTFQKPRNTNHGSTYTIREELTGRVRVCDALRGCPDPAPALSERVAMEVEAKKKDDPQAMLDFALQLRQEKDPGAVEWLRATGRKGHPLACMHLAEMYCLGELGLETSYEAAEELRKFALGIFQHLADRSESKPSFQEFLEAHAGVFKQAQRQQLASCIGTPPDLPIISRRCFALDFQTWLDSRGERFPVRANFTELLEGFAAEEGEKNLWLSGLGGGIAATASHFRVPRPTTRAEREELRQRWESYMRLRTQRWPQAWLAFEPSEEVEELQLLEAASRDVALVFVLLLALWTCVCTCSLCLALAAASAAGFGILLLLVCRALGPQSAVLQLVCMLIFAAASAAPLLRFLFFYSARNGPSKRVKDERSASFEADIQEPTDSMQPHPQESPSAEASGISTASSAQRMR